MKHNRLRPLALSTLLVAITACISIYAVRPSGTYFEVTKHLEILTSVFKGVHEFYVEEPEPGTLMSVAIDAMLDELDPYTIYYPESRIEDLRFMNTGEYGGIGALVQPIDGRTTVIEVYEGYPAQEAGIRPGDILLSVDGKTIDGEADEDVGEWLKGESGSQVKVRIDRPFGGGVLDLTVDRLGVGNYVAGNWIALFSLVLLYQFTPLEIEWVGLVVIGIYTTVYTMVFRRRRDLSSS